MVTFKQKGDFSKLDRFFERLKGTVSMSTLDKFGKQGVGALAAATPKDTGETAASWSYRIVRTKEQISLQFYNSNVQNGVPIAIILQYGHATGTGGWVEGRDYINPAVQPIFDRLANEAWEEVTRT